jgi:uncharacterized UPF0146 family protein
VRKTTRAALVGRLSDFQSVVEIGIGHRPRVAGDLAEAGLNVTATDRCERDVPTSVRFVRDDITDPDPTVYAGSDALYARNLPPELHRPGWDLARDLAVPLFFTTLGTDPSLIPVARETLPGTTLFVARGRNSKQA